MSQDVFIPAPGGAQPAAQPQGIVNAPQPLPADGPGSPVGPTENTTGLIVAGVILLVLAIALFFVRSGIKNALTSARVSLDAANFAATLWYAVLLLSSALLVLGLLGGFFQYLAYTGVAVGVTLVGLIACGLVTANARKSRR
jgi:hypothetical protein